jgi:hypothetical protein
MENPHAVDSERGSFTPPQRRDTMRHGQEEGGGPRGATEPNPNEETMKTKAKKLMPKVTSLADLQQRAASDDRYATLAMVAARNLGAMADQSATCDAALRHLRTEAMETDEAGVVEEVNYCRDLVPAQSA